MSSIRDQSWAPIIVRDDDLFVVQWVAEHAKAHFVYGCDFAPITMPPQETVLRENTTQEKQA